MSIENFQTIRENYEALVPGHFPDLRKLEVDEKIRSVHSLLLKGETKGHLSKDVLTNSLIKVDVSLLKTLRAEIQRELILIKGDSLSYELLVFHLISYLPYFQPEEEIFIPVKGRLISYTVEKILLTPSFLGSPLVAYGLNPKDEGDSPILLFKGTTYPTDDGFFLSFLADTNPWFSVGGLILTIFKGRLGKWIQEKNNIICAGISLGGALAQNAARLFPDSFEKVYAFSAPGLYPWEITPSTAEVYRVEQPGDTVPLTGNFYLPLTKIFKISNSDNNTGVLVSHIQINVADPNHIIEEKSVNEESKQWARRSFTIFHLVINPFLFFLGIIVLIFKLGISLFFSLFSKLQNRAFANS